MSWSSEDSRLAFGFGLIMLVAGALMGLAVAAIGGGIVAGVHWLIHHVHIG